MISAIVVGLGILVVVLGAVGFVAPGQFRAVFGSMSSRRRFIAAVALRLVFGIFLWIVADELRFPQVLRVIAVIAIAAAIGIVIMGESRLNRFIDWWLALSDQWLRLSGVFVVAFGGFMVYVAI